MGHAPGETTLEFVEFDKPDFHWTVFALAPIPAEYRDEIRIDLDGKVRRGVTLDVPVDKDEEFAASAASHVLYADRDERGRFRAVDREDPAARPRFTVLGARNWTTVASQGAWDLLMDAMRGSRANCRPA